MEKILIIKDKTAILLILDLAYRDESKFELARLFITGKIKSKKQKNNLEM
jgi:hypothetical protein